MIIAAIGRVDIYNAKGNYTLLLTSDRGWLVKIDGKYKIFYVFENSLKMSFAII